MSNLSGGSKKPNMKESDEAKHETRDEGAENNDDVAENLVKFSRHPGEDKTCNTSAGIDLAAAEVEIARNPLVGQIKLRGFHHQFVPRNVNMT